MAKLLFFGKLGDLAANREVDFDLPDSVSDVDALINHLATDNADLADALRHPSVRVAVNGDIVAKNSAISQNDEIAFLAPVSGG